MEDREYQANHIARIVEEVSAKRKVLAQLPTGGGKTVEFSLIAQRFFRSTQKSVLILVHREELLNQAHRTIKEMLDIDAYIINAKTSKFRYSRVYIGMVDSLHRRLNLFDNVGLVIIDECHIANFNKMHSIFLEELIIGFSATPISSSKKEPLNKYYSSLIAGPSIKQLIELGYLAQNITRAPKNHIDASKFKVNKLKGDYDERAMADAYRAPKHIVNVAQNYQRYCKGKKTIIFNVNIEHSIEVTNFLVDVGVNCKNLDSNSKDRHEILEWFRNTEDAVLCNVMIATVGFDEPTVKNIILNFSTLSLAKYIQCAGRGGRIIDEYFINKWQPYYPYRLELKDHFNIIDIGGNYTRFGDWNDERDWKRIFDNPHIPGDGIAPVKTCPDCEGLVHASLRVCNLQNANGEDCLHEFIKEPTQEEMEWKEMMVVTKNVSVEQYVQKNSKKYDYYTFFDLANGVIESMFEKNQVVTDEIATKYFKMYYKLCIEWYAKTMSGKNGNIIDISDSAWHIKRARGNFESIINRVKEQRKLIHS